jgi:hypothetical protein
MSLQSARITLKQHRFEVAETARGWEPLEIGGFVGAGLVLILATLAVVERRRPT